MSHYNLPHNHGQSIDRVLENMPTTESFQEVSILFQQLGNHGSFSFSCLYFSLNIFCFHFIYFFLLILIPTYNPEKERYRKENNVCDDGCCG